MYAIIETGGKQVKVEVGQTIYVEKLPSEAGAKYVFDKVVLVGGDKSPKVGSPYVKGATVEATTVKQGKSRKLVVFKYKSKCNQKVKHGHRQPYTALKIEAINLK